MKYSIIRYRVPPGSAARNEELVRAVFEDLQTLKPAGLHYASLGSEDGGFVHVVTAVDEEAEQRLTSLPSFVAFRHGIAERQIIEQLEEMHIVGNYNLLEDEIRS